MSNEILKKNVFPDPASRVSHKPLKLVQSPTLAIFFKELKFHGKVTEEKSKSRTNMGSGREEIC